jgi:hypothetical protein
MHSDEIPFMSAKKVGEFVRASANEELRANINRMLASLPPEQASNLRERFDLREEEPPPMDEFDLKLQAIAPDTIWQRFNPLSCMSSIGLRTMLRLYDEYLHNIDEEMCRMILLKFPSGFDQFR